MLRARMTATYERSKAGAVMLKIATMVSVLPMPMQFKTTAKATTSQTALMGVLVRGLTVDQKLGFGLDWGLIYRCGQGRRGVRGEW